MDMLQAIMTVGLPLILVIAVFSQLVKHSNGMPDHCFWMLIGLFMASIIFCLVFIPLFIIPFHGITSVEPEQHLMNAKVITFSNDNHSNTTEIKVLVGEEFIRASTNKEDISKFIEKNKDKELDITYTPWVMSPNKLGLSNQIILSVKLSKPKTKE